MGMKIKKDGKIITLTESDIQKIKQELLKEQEEGGGDREWEEKQRIRQRDEVVDMYVTQSMGKPYGHTLIIETKSGEKFIVPAEWHK